MFSSVKFKSLLRFPKLFKIFTPLLISTAPSNVEMPDTFRVVADAVAIVPNPTLILANSASAFESILPLNIDAPVCVETPVIDISSVNILVIVDIPELMFPVTFPVTFPVKLPVTSPVTAPV